MQNAVQIAQIIISVLLIVVILMQSKGSAFSGAMGGSSGSIYHTRRGLERTLFQLTIVLGVLFVALAVLSAILS